MAETLLDEVEQTREQMIESALTYGFGNERTIQLSEHLDRLLNAYQFYENMFVKTNAKE